MFCFLFSCTDFIFLHGNFLLTGFNFPIKVPLAIRTLYYCFEFCMLSAQYVGSVVIICVVFLGGVVLLFHYSAALLMFHYSVVFQLFHQCSVVLPVFHQSVPVFRQCSGVPYSVVLRVPLRCSWFYSMPLCPRFFSSCCTRPYLENSESFK